jgi:hypothetical protein
VTKRGCSSTGVANLATGEAPQGAAFSGGRGRSIGSGFFTPMRNRSLPGRAIAEFWRWREGSGGGLGLRHGRIADDLNPLSELHTLDQFWQLVVAVDPAPTLLGALDKLEDHGERSLVRQKAF